MGPTLSIVLWVLILGTAGVLVFGLITFFRHRPHDHERQNTLMRYRLYAQGLALLVFAVLLLFGKGNHHG